MFPIRYGNIIADAGIFQGSNVLDGAILRVAGHVVRLEFPAKARAKDEVAHGLVIHDFGWGHQHLENNPRFAAIDDIVYMVAQVRASTLQSHRRGIRISRADPQVRCALVIPANFSLRPSLLGDPIVPRGIFLSEFLLLWFGEGDR